MYVPLGRSVFSLSTMFFRDVSFLFTFLLLAKSSISTTCPYADTKFLTQMVDHFGNHDGTFQQQYQIVDTFYKPGGPILFYQGAENNQITCMVRVIGVQR